MHLNGHREDAARDECQIYSLAGNLHAGQGMYVTCGTWNMLCAVDRLWARGSVKFNSSFTQPAPPLH